MIPEQHVERMAALGEAVPSATLSVTTLIPILASLTYIMPLLVAARAEQPWHAALFAAMTVFGVLHGMCSLDGQTPVGGSSWGARSAGALTFVECCWFCFCFLQVAFVVLGPEDPKLNGNSRRRNGHVGLDVIVLARFVPLLTLAARLAQQDWGSPSTLWSSGALILNVLLLVGCCGFWLCGPLRRSQGLDVLLRARFWDHAKTHLVPLLVVLPIMAVAEIMRWQLSIAMGHVGFAVASAAVFDRVFGGKVADVLDVSSQNPVVIHKLLYGVPLVFLPTLAITLACDPFVHSPWRWPTLSMAATTPAGSFVLSFGGVPLAFAAAATFWAISMTPGDHTPGSSSNPMASMRTWKPEYVPHWRDSYRQLGCRLGYASIAFGIASASVTENTPLHDSIHVFMTVGYFLCLFGAVAFMTAGSPTVSQLAHVRVGVAVMALIMCGVLFALFLLVNQFIPNSFGIPHMYYALSEYTALTLLACWPLTWMQDVKNIRLPHTPSEWSIAKVPV